MNKGEERRDRKNVTEGVKGGKGRDRKREVRKSSLTLPLLNTYIAIGKLHTKSTFTLVHEKNRC